MNKALVLSVGLVLCAGTVNCNPLNTVSTFANKTLDQLQRLGKDTNTFVHKQPFVTSLAAHASALAFSRVRALAFGVKGARGAFKTAMAILGLSVTTSAGTIAIEQATS